MRILSFILKKGKNIWSCRKKAVILHNDIRITKFKIKAKQKKRIRTRKYNLLTFKKLETRKNNLKKQEYEKTLIHGNALYRSNERKGR